MKDITTIVFRLTISCLLAGLVMGTAFVFTDQAKKHNEHINEQRVMLGLLGYGSDRPAPADLALHAVYRYIVSEQEKPAVGYLLPGAGSGFVFVTIDLEGNFIARVPVDLSAAAAAETQARDRAVQAAVGAGKAARFADRTMVVTMGGQRQAYLLPGEFPGFKTFIKVIVALDQQFSVLGLEIMEHEEDPGLGGEIVQKYFKNQFKGKSFEKVKELEVVKTPLPDEYRRTLENRDGALSEADIAAIQDQYRDKDIYALTGATISSRSVTSGVRGIARKFAYRVAILDRVLAEQHIVVPF